MNQENHLPRRNMKYVNNWIVQKSAEGVVFDLCAIIVLLLVHFYVFGEPKMLISAAYAASDAAAAAPSAGEALMLNFLMILVLVVLFYVLLIMPQQRRFKEHNAMLKGLQKGDKVLTAAGFLATVDHMVPERDEVVVDLGGGVKVTALRSTIQTRVEDKAKTDVKSTL